MFIFCFLPVTAVTKYSISILKIGNKIMSGFYNQLSVPVSKTDFSILNESSYSFFEIICSIVIKERSVQKVTFFIIYISPGIFLYGFSFSGTVEINGFLFYNISIFKIRIYFKLC